VLAAFYTWRIEPHWLEFVYRDLPIAQSATACLRDGVWVQLSDLHIGPQVDDDYLIATFRRVDALQPDIVVHTGDLISYRSGHTIEQARRVLAHVPRGRLGSAAILGITTTGEIGRMPVSPQSVEQLFTAAGTTVLRNARTTIAGLHLIGLDDLWAGRFSLWAAFQSFDFNQPRSCSATIPIPAIFPDGRGTTAGSWRDIPHGGQVQAALFSRHRCLPVRQQTLHVRRIFPARRTPTLHQPWSWSPVARAVQCSSGNPRLSNCCGA